MYFKQFGIFQNNVCQCIIIILCNGKLIELGWHIIDYYPSFESIYSIYIFFVSQLSLFSLGFSISSIDIFGTIHVSKISPIYK